MSKRNKSKKYKKIVKRSKFWPIVKLFENRKKFMSDVSIKSQKKIISKVNDENLYDEIVNTLYKEKLRTYLRDGFKALRCCSGIAEEYV